MVFSRVSKRSAAITRVFLPAAALAAALYSWQSYYSTEQPIAGITASQEGGMFAITRRGLQAVTGAAAGGGGGGSQLRSVVGVGLHHEFQPPWPMPLPAPMQRNEKKHTLVLDIDETLIHTYGMTKHVVGGMEKTEEAKALASTIPLVDYSMLVRPHLKEFLTEVNDLFEVVYWTAGTASYCAAVLDAIERHVLGMEPSFYNYLEMAKEKKGEKGTTHANFYALSRTQTLESKQYMKYMPLLGRNMASVLMIDDNVRSFPLNPRHGVKIAAFDVDDRLLQYFLHAANEVQKAGGDPSKVDPRLLTILDQGGKELERLEKDTALLDLLPMLREVAKVPFGEDITKELDHWRDLEYVKCDDFKENMNPLSVVRTRVLGNVLGRRSAEPIPPLKPGIMNAAFKEEMTSEAKFMEMRPRDRSKL